MLPSEYKRCRGLLLQFSTSKFKVYSYFTSQTKALSAVLNVANTSHLQNRFHPPNHIISLFSRLHNNAFALAVGITLPHALCACLHVSLCIATHLAFQIEVLSAYNTYTSRRAWNNNTTNLYKRSPPPDIARTTCAGLS